MDRKYNRLFYKGKFSSGRLTNTSKSVYSFEGEVLSEEDDEYNSDSSLEHHNCKELHCKDHKIISESQHWIDRRDNYEINEEDDEVLSNN